MSQIQAVGWFFYKDEAQYNEFLSVFTDANRLPTTFSRWEQLTNKGIQEHESSGVIVVRAYAESTTEFIEFCRHHSLSLDAKGRTRFASFKAAQQLARK
ncbi:hypothetical protein ABRQ00_22590 [Pectobacterium aroidearum]|uniref:hypothetical protein n=1 Tax=Pectobacterium aroidearum TaxID=1201031 RepID=UPI002FC7F40C